LWNLGKVVASLSTVKHAAGGVFDLAKSGAKAIGKAAPIIYHKAEDPNLYHHVATMTIPLQVSVPSTFFASSSNCKNLKLEMDLTNTSALAVQLVPGPILVNYIRIRQVLYSRLYMARSSGATWPY